MTDKAPNFRAGIPACFAPPMTPERVSAYKELATSAPAPVADAMNELIGMVEMFQETPKSTETPQQFVVQRDGKLKSIDCAPLAAAEVARIWDVVPWEHELNAMGVLFDKIDNESRKPLRDAAFHLLWFGQELTRDREPMTRELIDK